MSDAQRYGDPLSPERQAELRALLDAWAASPAPDASPFGRARRTGEIASL